MGAVAGGGLRVLNHDVLGRLALPAGVVDVVTARAAAVVAERERDYRGDHPPPDLRGRPVILVDDGLATGATMRVAVRAVTGAGASPVVVGRACGPAVGCAALRSLADEVVCLRTPRLVRRRGRLVRRLLGDLRRGGAGPPQSPRPTAVRNTRATVTTARSPCRPTTIAGKRCSGGSSAAGTRSSPWRMRSSRHRRTIEDPEGGDHEQEGHHQRRQGADPGALLALVARRSRSTAPGRAPPATRGSRSSTPAAGSGVEPRWSSSRRWPSPRRGTTARGPRPAASARPGPARCWPRSGLLRR